MLHANLPEDKKPDINPQLSDAIQKLRAYFPVELRGEKNPDPEQQGGFNQCRFVDLPANQPDEKVAENKMDPALLENKGTRLAILASLPFEVYKAKKIREEKRELKDDGAVEKIETEYRKRYDNRLKNNNQSMKNAFRIYRDLAEKDKPTYPAFLTYGPEDKKNDLADDEKEIKHPQYQEKVTSSFSRFMYIGDQGRVALAANCDLHTWLRQNNHTTITEEEFKENVTQLFIAIDRLHKENKLHRDIKPANILVYVREATADKPRRIHLELADLDTTVDASQKKLDSTGTLDYLAPECKVPVVPGQPELKMSQSAYNMANKKALDYYATGCVLNDMLMSYYPGKMKEDERLVDVYVGLINDNPARRMSIRQAMESSYFGATPEERERYFSGVKRRQEHQDSWQYSYPKRNDTFQIHSGDLQLLHFEAVSLNMQMKDMEKHPHHFEDGAIIDVLNEKIKNLNEFIINIKLKVENNAELTDILNKINSGVVEARQQMDEGVRKSYKNYFSNELIDDNRLFRLLTKRTDKQKRYDFRAALSSLDWEIYTLEKSEDKKELCTLLKTYRAEIAKEASHIAVRELPRLSENIQRWLFKVKNPDHPANEPEGVNTIRGKECSEKLASFQWGKLIGGIGMLVFGGILVTAAVMTLMASFGSATPLSAALGYIGVNVSAAAITTVIGVTSVSTVAASAGLSVAISGAGKIGTSLYNKYDKAFGKRTTQKLFDHPLEEKNQDVIADPVAGRRNVRERR